MTSWPSPISPRTSATCVSPSSTLSYACTRNSPNSVGSSAVATGRTSRSLSHAVLDQVGDRDDQQVVPPGESPSSGTRAIVPSLAHDLADDAGRREAGDAAPDRRRPRCGPARTSTPPLARPQREHVARPQQILRLASPASMRRENRRRAIGGRNTGARLAPRASIDTHIAVSRSDELTGTSSGISSASSRSGVIARHTRPRPWVSHEVDRSPASPSRRRSSGRLRSRDPRRRRRSPCAPRGWRRSPRRSTQTDRDAGAAARLQPRGAGRGETATERRQGCGLVMIVRSWPASSATRRARRTCR